ncbi:hypothetical protein [Amycolatopsis taiwanensis]|uniref:hypothetical protein n=1 Tax=Amycolatopsis taiwanensis TaxID=342230 RepID=UPI000485441D|nr:hypothetical protein [Amycolatopsis taiwanensis]
MREHRGKLLQRLIAEGYKAIHKEHERTLQRRRAAIKAGAGSLGENARADHLDSVSSVRRRRDDEWPE